MFASRGEDCVFVETAKNVKNQPHMHIECIPIPEEIGQSAPIYFKVAIGFSFNIYTGHCINFDNCICK